MSAARLLGRNTASTGAIEEITLGTNLSFSGTTLNMTGSAVNGSFGAATRARGVMVHIGDSNTNGRPGWRSAYEHEWLAAGGIYEGWTSYNIGQNGSTLANWATVEVANADNPSYSSLPPADYNNVTNPGAGALARAINANPDLIVLSLGTNDENSPSNRATIGTEASLRTNLALLVNFLLDRTHSSIILRMPQPFAHEDFLGVTQWVNAAEAQEASRRVRQVYGEWVGRNGRVIVYDSHTALFGLSCDNKAVNAQDPYGGGSLIADSLHPNDLGYRRIAQQIAMQLTASYPRTPNIVQNLPRICESAFWAVSLFVPGSAIVSGTSVTVNVDIAPANVIALESSFTAGGSPTTRPVAQKHLIEAFERAGNLTAFRELMAVPKKGKVFAYSHATGTTTALTDYSLAQIVTAVTPHYAQITFQSASMAGFGGGVVTFFVEDAIAIPFTSTIVASVTMTATPRYFGPALANASITGGRAIFRGYTGNAVAVSIYVSNIYYGQFSDGTGTFAAPGKLVGTFTFVAGQYASVAPFVFDPTNYPDGKITVVGNSYLTAILTSGNIATDCNGALDLHFTA